MSRMTAIRILGCASVVLFIAMAAQSSALVPSIPVIQFTFSEVSFNAILAQWGPRGVERFKWHFVVDYPFLVSYGSFGYLLSRHIRHGDDTNTDSVVITRALPFAAFCDAAENGLHLYFLHAANIPAVPYFVAGCVSTLKWALIGVGVVGIAYRLRRRH